MVAFQASLSPVFWTSMAKLPHCPRFIVAGPDFVTTSTGAGADAVTGVVVLMVHDAGRAVRQSPGGRLTVGIAALGIEPLDGARDIGEADTILCIGVELSPVTNDQPLIRTDRSCGRQHCHFKLAIGRGGVDQRVASAER